MEQKFNQWIQLLRCTELSGNERIVLALILNYHNNGNWDNTSLTTLKTDSGLTAPTIAKCVKVLEGKGLIKKVISSYKKNINATNDYLPNYETIQQMIDKHNGNCVLGMKEICGMKEIDIPVSKNFTTGMKETCIRDIEDMKEIDIPVSKNFAYGYERNFTTGMKETCNKYNIKDNIKEEIEKENKENPENPVIENMEAISFSDSDFGYSTDSPNNLQKENEVTENPVCDSPKSSCDSKSKPYRVNLNYIDDLERQFNGYTDATSPNAAENSPKATANPNLTSDYIKSIPCMHINLSTLNDLIEASKRPTLVIDAMEKSIKLLHTYRGVKGTLFYIAQVYDKASQTIKSKNNGMSERQLKLATDKLAAFKKDIIDCGGTEELRLAQYA